MGNTNTAEEPQVVARSLENLEGGTMDLNPADYLLSPVGYRVLGVQTQSPCSQLGFVSFFDFIIAANGVPLRTLDTTFIELIKGSEDKPLPLAVYNTKNHTLREVVVVPSRKWPGEGMLGLTIRFDTFRHADESVMHILEVERDSPAEIAGLVAGADYLLGTAEKLFQDPEQLLAELRTHLDHPLEFFVYNKDSDEVRVIVIMPTEDWGGDGILGASVGAGYLHTLPSSACESLGRSAESLGNRATTNSAFGPNGGHVDAVGVGSGAAAAVPGPAGGTSGFGAPPMAPGVRLVAELPLTVQDVEVSSH